MAVAVLVVAVLAVLAAGALLVAVRRLHGRLAEARTALDALAGELHAAPADVRTVLGEGTRSVITVEILNPLEVAAGQSALARRLGALAPAMVAAEVTRRAGEELEARLVERGVRAQVRIVDVR